MTELILPTGTALEVRDRRAGAVEHRDPRGATRRLGWSSPDLPMVEEWNADAAFRHGYLANVIAYRCTQIRARSGASVPIVAGRKLGDLKTRNDNSPLARLLGPPPGGPAPKLSARKLIRWTIAQQIVTGRRAWEIETERPTDPESLPVAFWPLVASQLKPIQSTGGVEWFRVFEYGPRIDGKALRLQPGHVFYGWDPSGTDFRQAESQLQAARFDLTLVNLCDRYGIGFLRNNAVPAAIITTAAFPNDQLRQRFRQNWNNELQGVDNAGRVTFNEVGDGEGGVGDTIDVKTLGISAKDARLVEARKEAMMEVAIALGVPWSKLDASGRTFANAEAEDRTYWEETILPDLQDLQDDINMQLAPRFGSDVVWFDLSGVRALARRVTPVSQTVGAPSYVNGGLWSINEGRIDTGQDPLEGDQYNRLLTIEEQMLLRGSQQTDTPPARTASEPEVRTAGEADTREGSEAEPGTTGDQGAPLATSPAVETRVADPEAIEARRARIWRAADATVSTIERRWERAFVRLFTRQADATVARLTGKRGRQLLTRAAETRETVDPAQLFDPQFWTTETQALAADLYEQAAGAGLDRLAASFGVALDVEAPYVQDFLAERGNQLAGGVTQTTYDQIVATMGEGVSAGESIEELADRIRHVFTVASEARATVIARTEVISAYNGSSVLAAAQLPEDVVAGQEWIATRDARTRGAHASADGQVVRVGEPFNVDGEELAYPGDPAGEAGNTIQCRCTVAFLTPDEMTETLGRARPQVDVRTARAFLTLAAPGLPFDELGFRRALEMAS